MSSEDKYKELLVGETPLKVIRGLTQKTFEKFKVTIGKLPSSGEEVLLFPYRDIQGNPGVAQKRRFKNKSFSMAYSQPVEGLQLFGQHLWGNKGGKYLVVTEGEFDAMAVSQIQNHRWPVVSVGSGASGSLEHLLLNLPFLEKFENIVLMFDNDDPGKEAAQEVAKSLSGHLNIKVAELPLKDPNDMLQAGRSSEVINAMFNAPEWKPEGIVSASELLEEWSKVEATNAVPYPWDGLTATTMGLRGGEIVTIGAGSGVGKTQFCMEVVYDLITKRDSKVGLVFREQGWSRTLDGLVGLELGKKVHVERALQGLPEDIRATVQEKKGINNFDADEAREALERLLGSGQVFIDKQWGSEDFDDLISKIRFLAISKKCNVIILDHISIVISGLDIKDERKALDVAYTKLRELCEQTGVSLIIVSHLRRPDGNKGFEEGLDISLSHFRGSQAIGQLSDMVIGLQRNKKDPEKREWTEVAVIKNRFTGEDGVTACWLKWDDSTGRLQEGTPPFLEEGQDEVLSFPGDSDVGY